MYSEIVQKIVDTLEENLLTTWQLEHYAEKIGYSKFYLNQGVFYVCRKCRRDNSSQ